MTDLFIETAAWMAVFFGVNSVLCGSLSAEISRYCLRVGSRWRYFFLVPFVLMAMCIPTALLAYKLADKASWQDLLSIILASACGSLFLALSTVVDVGPRRARKNADRSNAWGSWLDGDVPSKKTDAVRLAALHRMTNLIIFLSVAQAAMASISSAAEHSSQFEHRSPEIDSWALAWFASAAAAGLLMLGVKWLSDYRNLHRELVTACLLRTIFVDLRAPTQVQTFRMSRWRNDQHQHLFHVANTLEKCLPRIRRRYTKGQYDEIAKAYSALAIEIRSEASRSRKCGARLEVLLSVATTLAMNDDIVAACKRLPSILTVELGQVEHVHSSRVGRLLLAVDDALARHSRVILAIGVTIVFMYYLSTGQVDNLIGFLRATIGG